MQNPRGKAVKATEKVYYASLCFILMMGRKTFWPLLSRKVVIVLRTGARFPISSISSKSRLLNYCPLYLESFQHLSIIQPQLYRGPGGGTRPTRTAHERLVISGLPPLSTGLRTPTSLNTRAS